MKKFISSSCRHPINNSKTITPCFAVVSACCAVFCSTILCCSVYSLCHKFYERDGNRIIVVLPLPQVNFHNFHPLFFYQSTNNVIGSRERDADIVTIFTFIYQNNQIATIKLMYRYPTGVSKYLLFQYLSDCVVHQRISISNDKILSLNQ